MPRTTIGGDQIADGTIADVDVSVSAAIQGTKISPNFGSQSILTTGNIGAGTLSPVHALDVLGDANVSSLYRVGGVQISSANLSDAARLTVAGTTGAVQFSNAGAFAADVSTFFWDNTNKRLGIGAASPSTALQVVGTVTANSFAGGGSSLTALTAANISAGTAGISISGNAATVTTNANLTGPVTSVGNVTFISASGITATSYGSASSVVIFTVGSDGRLTAASAVSIQIAQSQVTGLASALALYLSLAGGTITGALGVGGAAPASAILSATSTTQGFLPPRMTTAQRDAIVSPASGLVIYNTTTAQLETFV